MSTGNTLKCNMGVYDLPNVQLQPDFEVDLARSNVALFGASMSGKTNFLKLLINILHQKRNENNERIFILDFSGTLLDYRFMPLVSAYFDNSNEEYVKRIFKIMDLIMKENVRILGSGNYLSGDNMERIPHTTFIIDNLNSFVDEERYSVYHEKFGRLCREGKSRGVSIVFTASDTKGISRYLLSFEQIITLGLSSDKVLEIMGAKAEAAGRIPGRGLANVTEKPEGITGTFDMNYPYEIQCRKATKYTDSQFLGPLMEKFAYDYQTKQFRRQVKKYQIFPNELTWEMYDSLKQPLDRDDKQPSQAFVELGLDYVEFKPVGIDFRDTHCVAIYGKKEFGKTNLLKLILKGIAEKDARREMRFVFFDDGRKELEEIYNFFKGDRTCDYIYEFKQVEVPWGSNGKTESRKLSPILQFYKLLHESYLCMPDDYRDYRNGIPQQIYGLGEKDDGTNIPEGADKSTAPPTVFVIQSKSVYLNSSKNGNFIHYFLPELLDVAEDRRLYFIFTDVKKITENDVNAVFNSSLKMVFLLDNIAEFAGERGGKTVFGDMDVKQLKEEYGKCELGDGYCYDVEADSLKKCKFIHNV